MKTLSLFIVIVSIAQLSSALPFWWAVTGPAVLPEVHGNIMPTIGIRQEGASAGATATETPELSASEREFLDLIKQSLNSLLQPIREASSLGGLKLKTKLELEKEDDKPNDSATGGDATQAADVATARDDNWLDGVKFKATIELEKEKPDGSCEHDNEDDEECNGDQEAR